MKNRMPKMPDGIPKPVTDAIEGLREKRLLPVAIGLLVAIVALPVVLSNGSEAPPPKSDGESTAAETAFQLAPETQPVVLASDEGVRDYKERLGEAAKNPFVQQFTAPEGGEAASTEGSASTADTSASAGSVTASIPSTGGGSTKKKDSTSKPGSSGSAGVGPSTSQAKPETQTVNYTIDAWVGHGNDMKLREGIERLTFLPNDQSPQVVFVGVSNDKKRALFTVSRSVLGVTGDGICLLSSCDLLSLAEGKAATFVLSADNLLYSVKLVRINRVVGAEGP